MRWRCTLLLLAVVLAQGPGCRKQQAQPEEKGQHVGKQQPAREGERGDQPAADRVALDEAKLARLRSATTTLKKELKTALREALPRGIPEAIAVCQTLAPTLATQLSVEGLNVGRSSERYRNPANAPEPWMLPLMQELSALPATPGTYRSTVLGQGRLAYAEPLYVEAPCLMCHGQALGPEVKAALGQRYPGDRATGYREGDFRGIVWATLSTR